MYEEFSKKVAFDRLLVGDVDINAYLLNALWNFVQKVKFLRKLKIL